MPKVITAQKAREVDAFCRARNGLPYAYGGVEVDGEYGPLTQAAVAKFQAANGVTGDGSAVGPKTLAAMKAKGFDAPPPAPAPKPVIVGPADDQLTMRWNCLGGQTLVEAVAEIRDKVLGTNDRGKTGVVTK